MRAALVATVLAASVEWMPATAAPAADVPQDLVESPASPLIAYAREMAQSEPRSELREQYIATENLRAVTFEMERHPPPADEECAHTLGASRFAQQYAQLATIHYQLGNFEAVIDANESALACQPRVAAYQAAIASAHIALTHIDEARSAIERAQAIDPEDPGVRDVRARVDFIQERWADAAARFRLQALDERYAVSPLADYARCYLWLAQRRAGVRNPELPPPPTAVALTPDEPSRKQWPEHIIDALRGDLSEEELVNVIRDTSDRQAREWLTEALFYVGELRLAEGDEETARRQFASVVNLKVLNFVEYGMARAELKKMRDREPVADAATAGASTRLR